MSKKQLDIDGYIGPGWFSKNYIRNFLQNNKEVELVMSSLGGDLDTAIASHNKIAEHGNVLVTYTGFNASSSTIFGLKAKKSRIASNSFFLIHKVMFWVDAWGFMNEDQLEDLIQKLEGIKDNSEKITLQIANMYHEKSGKPISEILNLMKQEKWLNAKEAVEMGLVDEIYEPDIVLNLFENSKMFAMIKENGLPVPMIVNAEISGEKEKEPSWLNKLFSKLDSTLKPIENSNTKSIIMHKNFTFINQVLNVEGLESTDGKTFVLTQENIQAINAKFDALEKAQNESKKSNEDLVQAQNELKTSKDALTTATNLIDGIHANVKAAEGIENKIAAVTKILSEKPGQGAAQNLGKDKNTAGVENQVIIDNLEHNREADANL